ncbi:lysine-N-methylase [Bacillus sp. BGMRC 2118]|nr:lysine-N-methylase [Bacillus sp. BGMRC 2118]
MAKTSEKTRSILVPTYMQEFKCIGSSCEDSCCVGWRVSIDQDTYKKYKKNRNQDLKPLLDQNITRQRSNSSVENYAKIKMEKGGRCSFLSEDNLCKVQSTLGEDLLSNTCATYPRTFNAVNNIVEKSATMSCPEAARLALLNPNGIDFVETEEPADTRGFLTKSLSLENPAYNGKPQQYFWELRIFTIEVLQNRNYSLEDRLITLGMFYQSIQKQIDQGNVEQIPNLVDSYRKLISSSELRTSLTNIPVNLAIQMKLCKELIEYRLGQGISHQRYLECINETLSGIQYSENDSLDEMMVRYQVALENYYKPFIKEYEYILENYLVNYVFKNMFPLGKKSLFDDYVMLIIHFSMIKLHLIGMSSYHKGITTDLTVKLIQSFSKIVEHNDSFLRKVFDLFEENGFTTMAYMSILIKN